MIKKSVLIFLLICFVLINEKLISQTQSSAIWKLQGNSSAITTGPITAPDEKPIGVSVGSDASVGNYTTVQKIKPDATTSGSAGTGPWPVESVYNQNRFVQFSISPLPGVSFTSDSLVLLIGAKGILVM